MRLDCTQRTCTSTPRYDQISGICSSSLSLPPAPFCCASGSFVCGSTDSSTFLAGLFGLGKAVRMPSSMGTGRLSALRMVEMERSARRMKRESKFSTAWESRSKLSVMTVRHYQYARFAVCEATAGCTYCARRASRALGRCPQPASPAPPHRCPSCPPSCAICESRDARCGCWM